jgi:hypothetical protein
LGPLPLIDNKEGLRHGDNVEVFDMARPMEFAVRRPRISVDVPLEIRRRLRIAAARRDVTVRRYVLDAIEEQLRHDLGEDADSEAALTAKTDPVLASLWDNPKDAAYDDL